MTTLMKLKIPITVTVVKIVSKEAADAVLQDSEGLQEMADEMVAEYNSQVTDDSVSFSTGVATVEIVEV